MSTAYVALAAAGGLAVWTGLVAWWVWAVASDLERAKAEAAHAGLELAQRDTADALAREAEQARRVEELEHERDEAIRVGQEVLDAAEARGRAGALGAADPDAALGLLLGERANGGPPGGAGGDSPPPGPTA